MKSSSMPQEFQQLSMEMLLHMVGMFKRTLLETFLGNWWHQARWGDKDDKAIEKMHIDFVKTYTAGWEL